MALTTVTKVEQIGALIPELFGFSDPVTKQASLDAVVQAAIDDASAWMTVYLGTNYAGVGTLTAAESAVQTRAESYLAMAYLEPILRAEKVRGTHSAMDAEDSQAFEDLLEKDWEGLARSFLAKWIQLDVTGGETGAGKGFALPYFQATDSPDPCQTDSEDIQIRRIADEARGVPERIVPTVVL